MSEIRVNFVGVDQRLAIGAAQTAAQAAQTAAQAAAFAEEFSAPAYDTIGDGEAATATGHFFRVPVPNTDPVEYTRYQRTSGGSIEAAPLATTAALASPTGSSLVGFVQAGTGAVPRTAQAKLRETVSIDDFGGSPEAADNDAALEAAFATGKAVFIPSGTYVIDAVTGSNVHIYGPGTLKKKAGTKGCMISLAGSNRLEGVTIDYDWENTLQTLPYYNNIGIQQIKGSLDLKGVRFRRSFSYAVRCAGASLSVSKCVFVEGAPHNDLAGGDERVPYYIFAQADEDVTDQVISIHDSLFIGSSLEASALHLNPTGIFITASELDGVRYQAANIAGNVMLGCATNAQGNVTGAIDTYNGVVNATIFGNTIRFYTYAGIKIQNSSVVSITGNTITNGSVPAGAGVLASFGIITTDKVRSSIIEQRDVIISGNILEKCTYTAIYNTCDYTIITKNVINGVEVENLGHAIDNAGAHVSIDGNKGRDVKGLMMKSVGDYCLIDGNDMHSGDDASPGALLFSGAKVKINRNFFRSGPASGGSGIRTNGPASHVEIAGNLVESYPYGVDLRTGGGAVDVVDLGVNQFIDIGISDYNIAGTVTNVSRQPRSLPIVSSIYDPPGVSSGSPSPIQTVAVPGAEIGDFVQVQGQRDTAGAGALGWVSAAGTVSYLVWSPSSTPADLASTAWNVLVTKA